MIHILGAICIGIATLIACLNFFLAFIRPLYSWWSKKTYKYDSGLPGVGTIFLIVGALLLPFDWDIGLLALVLICLDTGGLPWFVAIMSYRWLRGREL